MGSESLSPRGRVEALGWLVPAEDVIQVLLEGDASNVLVQLLRLLHLDCFAQKVDHLICVRLDLGVGQRFLHYELGSQRLVQDIILLSRLVHRVDQKLVFVLEQIVLQRRGRLAVLGELVGHVRVVHADGGDLRLRDHAASWLDGGRVHLAGIRHIHLLDLLFEVVVVFVDIARGEIDGLLSFLLLVALKVGQVIVLEREGSLTLLCLVRFALQIDHPLSVLEVIEMVVLNRVVIAEAVLGYQDRIGVGLA